MANNINVLEVLESKPNGTKLWCVLFGKCFLDGIDINNIRPIRIGIEKGDTFKLTANAKLGGKYIDGDCLLYPSKEMRDWSRFAWKKGDILISSDGGTEVIFDKWYDDTYTSFYCKHYLNSEDETKFVYYEEFLCTTERYAIEDKDKSQIYIGIIEERLGGKLNRETLKLEKAQSEFKDGDIVCMMDIYDNYCFIFIYKNEDNENFYYHALMTRRGSVNLVENEYLSKPRNYSARFATDLEKRQLFYAIANENKTWDAEKKQIVDLRPKYEFKPFDKVLVRNYYNEVWKCDFYRTNIGDIYACIVNGNYLQCIPYNEETAKLIGTKEEYIV